MDFFLLNSELIYDVCLLNKFVFKKEKKRKNFLKNE